MERTQIAINYLKTWFILDLLASFPYQSVIRYDDGDIDSI